MKDQNIPLDIPAMVEKLRQHQLSTGEASVISFRSSGGDAVVGAVSKNAWMLMSVDCSSGNYSSVMEAVLAWADDFIDATE